MSGLRPSEGLAHIMSGQKDLDSAPRWLKSWASFWIYKTACQVLSGINKEQRREKLRSLPEKLVPYVEDECKRMWSTRKEKQRGDQ